MEALTLKDLLEDFTKALKEQIDSEGLSKWSIESTGMNILESISQYDSGDLQDLLYSIKEGQKVSIELDLSQYVVEYINDIFEIRNRKRIT